MRQIIKTSIVLGCILFIVFLFQIKPVSTTYKNEDLIGFTYNTRKINVGDIINYDGFKYVSDKRDNILTVQGDRYSESGKKLPDVNISIPCNRSYAKLVVLNQTVKPMVLCLVAVVLIVCFCLK